MHASDALPVRVGGSARRNLGALAAWEGAIGVVLLAVCAWLAWDYLAPADLEAPGSSTVVNELIVELSGIELADAQVTLNYTRDREDVWIDPGAGGVAVDSDPHATIWYRGNGFMTAEKWNCASFDRSVAGSGPTGDVTQVLPDDVTGARVDLADLGDGILAGVDCSRDTAVVRRTGQGKVYMAPSLVRVYSGDEGDDELLPVTLTRTVHVPTSWVYEQDESELSWTANKEIGPDGVMVSGYDQAAHTPRVLVPPEDGAVMTFTDADAEARAERDAWISALVGGVALALITSSTSALLRREPTRTPSKERRKTPASLRRASRYVSQ